VLSTGHGRKTDEADAISVGIAALTATRLHTASVDAAITALRAVVEHREDLVKTRTQTVNRLHVLLTHLSPSGAARGLTADRAADILRQIRPREPGLKTLRSLAADLVAEVRALDRRIAKAATDIAAAVESSGTTLTELSGIGIRSPAIPQDGTPTEENAPPAKATEKRCAVSNDASPTSSTDNSSTTQPDLGQTRGGHSGATPTSSAASPNPAR
jgi:hypothetical protein